MHLRTALASLVVSTIAVAGMPAASQAGGLRHVDDHMKRIGNRLETLCPLNWLRDRDHRPAPKMAAKKAPARHKPMK